LQFIAGFQRIIDMKKCLIYANCQGYYIGQVLMSSPQFAAQYEVDTQENYAFNKPLDAAKFGAADLLVYQPISAKHEGHCTNRALSKLKPGANTVAFPYIRNDGIFPLYEAGDTIVGGTAIKALQDGGLSCDEVKVMALAGGVDFNLKERYWQSMAIMRKQERDCAINSSDPIVVVTDFIEENLSSECLFYSQNHVTNKVLYHVANGVLQSLCMDTLTPTGPKLMQTLVSWPLSPYEIKAHNLTWAQECPHWKEYMKKCIELVFKGNPVT
jgi:hypothetical protein